MITSHSAAIRSRAWVTRLMLLAAGFLAWTASPVVPGPLAEPKTRQEKDGVVAQLQTAKPEPLMSLAIVGAKDGVVTRQVATGWPLTLRLSSNGELGIGRPFVTPYFPQFGDFGFIVFADPDGCPSFDALNAPCPGGVDETMLEFWPDMDRAGVSNPHGNVERLIALTESGGGGSPKVFIFDHNTGLNNLLVRYGPYVGSDDVTALRCVGGRLAIYPGTSCLSDADCNSGTCRLVPLDADGYGYGADDDLPGLALFSDTGVGLVLDQSFNPGQPRQSRNLAGLVHSVAYELNDASSKTSVLVHLNVPGAQTVTLPSSAGSFIPAASPRGLFTPAVLADFCVGDPQTCSIDGAGLVRIDGGPVTAMTAAQVGDYLNSHVVTLRAFVVNGTAPSLLTDLNGDGFVGAKDAALAGYSLLSGEKTLRLVGYYDEDLFKLALPYDFDGNGKAIGAVAAPNGPGSITPVPR
jgi:hypothetical protein